MKLLIIEAPGKLKKLQPMMKKLRPGEDWQVVASGGHIRDLPAKGQDDSMITTGVRKNYTPVYEILDKSAKAVRTMKAAAKQADEIYLATDPDREGESISWHIQQVLAVESYKRITFNEITLKRVEEALANPRQIDLNRVASQECRRVLDRLVGYLVTQELRRLMGKPTSAGRVQSPAVFLVVLREREIRNFQVINHFGVRLYFADVSRGTTWYAEWQPVPDFASKDFPYVQDSNLAQHVAGTRNVVVESCEDRKAERHPPAPFISSTLQQAASNALKWDPDKTMQVAQRLYEQGVITYHRTDNPNVPDEAMVDIRMVAKALGMTAVDERRTFKSAEGAQEGHPAITPTYWADAKAGENDDELALYKLIWVRALASQLEAAIFDVRTVKLLAVGPNGKALRFGATGETLFHPGWRKLLKGDDTDDEEDTKTDNPIPALSPKQILSVHSGELLKKKTQPPSRYTKASLIKEMERRGIGRPSTFASILKNITSKGLIEEKSRKLVPAPLGEETIAKLEGFFSFVELDFTRELERDLDKIAQGQDTYGAVVARLHKRLQEELSQQSGMPSVAMTSAPRAAASGGAFNCPKCNQPLARRQRKGDGGYDFWGCTGFKSNGCKVSFPNLNGKPDLNKPRGV
ncbi:type I DNA topoisomerase [Pseudomonas extremorientalis]|uniref:type I DNA topoisomerase n=1 Tax=Pseudomonas extremorientalis TaxID=169669 RepID=UPI0027371097|nr:type I DNA topoisomerase [Pseudomonas extremorientalis]WLG57765.1 type I DNA topoisomerase [Pseudomonas extremorientalis]